jgi:hypothetical protein
MPSVTNDVGSGSFATEPGSARYQSMSSSVPIALAFVQTQQMTRGGHFRTHAARVKSYSITSSALASSVEGTVRPAASGMWLEYPEWRNLRHREAIRLRGEVNWLIGGLCGERFPAIDLAHVNLAGSEQSPEQHGRGLR